MKVIGRLSLFLFFLLSIYAPLTASSIIEEIAGMDLSPKVEDKPPNPLHLNPQWWSYFNVEGEDLKQHIATTLNDLQQIYLTLPLDEQAVASPIINRITNTLNALPYAKQQNQQPPLNSKPFLKAYTLEKQLEVNQQIRKLKESIKKEEELNKQSKERLVKAHAEVDNLMVNYMGQSQLSSKKLIHGLEIISLGANIGLGEENVRHTSQHIEELNAKLLKLEDELEYSLQHFDASNADESQLEKNIAFYDSELTKAQKDLSTAEANLLGSFSHHSDRSQHLFLEIQLLQSSVNRAFSWIKLAFHTLKFNLIMHLTDHLEAQQILRDDLEGWREKTASLQQQINEWQKTALKEQDSIRQEYTALIANPTAHNDSKQMRNNQIQRENLLNILATLELVQNEISNTEWLIDFLETHFHRNSSFLWNWWIDLTSFFSHLWNSSIHVMNYSLFKVSGIPITMSSIIKMLIIFSISFWLSILMRSAMVSFGKKRGVLTESTLHSLSGLARYFIMLLGLIFALCSIGLDFSSLIFIAGALMFGISLGLQSIANNFFCGLRILFERKLKIGDEIEFNSGHHGKVTEIHVQNTVVCTSDGQKIIVPNSELVDNTVFNWARHHLDYRRLHIPFSVAAGCDKELVRKIVIEATQQVPCTLPLELGYGEPEVWLVNFNKHALEFKLVVWVDYKCESVTESKEADFLWEIETAFKKHRIPLPSTFHDLIPHLHLSPSSHSASH